MKKELYNTIKPRLGKIRSLIGQLGLLSLVVLGLIFTSCLRDDAPDEDWDDEAWVNVTVVLPRTAELTTRADENEQEVTAIRILVFEQDGATYRFSYQVPGEEITSTGEGTFRALLRAEDTSLKLMVLANVEESLTAFDPAEGTPETEIRQQIEIAFPTAGMTGNLPMYGETLLESGIGNGETRATLHALRAIARVDVTMNLEEGSGEFILEEVRVFRVYDRFRLIPDAVADIEAPLVTAVTIPDNAAFLSSPVIRYAADGADSITNIYIPESYPAGGERAEVDGTTVVVVGGRFGGSDQTTYYRADFNPGLAGHPFGQVLRNHQYVFHVVRVSASGWSTAEEAANNFATSIVVEVQAWEDFSSDLHFGQNRFAVSSRSISLRFAQNRMKSLDVESTLPYTIQWLDAGGNPTGETASQPSESIANGNFRVTIEPGSGDPETTTRLQFQTLRNNMAGTALISDRLRISVDNWSVDITVNQDNAAVYSNRTINVLTGHDYTSPVGNLGSTLSYPATDNGLAMRMILETQFSANGTIGISGFAFDDIHDYILGGVSIAATDGANLAAVTRLINTQDIIYLSYAAEESTAVANVITAWLNGSPNRVLILGTDDASTNIAVRNAIVPSDGTWSYSISTGTFSRAPVVPGETDEFFSGPFGEVNAVTDIRRNDTTVGYCLTPSGDVTRLITANSNVAMIFGVNKSRRIVYLGDADLFRTTQLSNNTGTVGTDLDRLMGNVWGWIVEQVIYGDD